MAYAFAPAILSGFAFGSTANGIPDAPPDPRHGATASPR